MKKIIFIMAMFFTIGALANEKPTVNTECMAALHYQSVPLIFQHPNNMMLTDDGWIDTENVYCVTIRHDGKCWLVCDDGTDKQVRCPFSEGGGGSW